MGCGASKAAQVSEQDISIVNHPARRIDAETSTHNTVREHVREEEEGDETEGGETEGGEGGGGIDLVYSGQSEIERAVREATSMSASMPHSSVSQPVTTAAASAMTLSQDTRTHTQDTPTTMAAPLVLEFCMDPDNRLEAKAPLPPRLKKLESAPVMTAEMLDEKQYRVAEKKKQEIEKRLARSRVSRKDRLRREVMAAREMQNKSGESVAVTGNFDYSRLHEEPAGGGVGGSGGDRDSERGRGSYDTNTPVEGDTTYNAEEGGQGFWEGGSSDEVKVQSSAGSSDSADREGQASLAGSTGNMEQYM